VEKRPIHVKEALLKQTACHNYQSIIVIDSGGQKSLEQ